MVRTKIDIVARILKYLAQILLQSNGPELNQWVRRSMVREMVVRTSLLREIVVRTWCTTSIRAPICAPNHCANLDWLVREIIVQECHFFEISESGCYLFTSDLSGCQKKKNSVVIFLILKKNLLF